MHAKRRRLYGALLLFAAAQLCGAATLTTDSAELLHTGSFAWDDAAPSGPLRIVVSRAQQRAYVYRGDVLVGVSTVSTGKPGHRTPLGDFTILEKRVRHRSNRYSNAPMPFMQRLTWDGVAMHAGLLPGYPASHGCIRLPWGFARKLFAETGLGALVTVTDDDVRALPRVEMAARQAPVPAPPQILPPTAVAAVEAAPLAIAPPAPAARVELASIERPRPVSWREQSAEDFVTWGSAHGRASGGTQ